MTLAFCFPGQGSQAVGMGRALADSSAAAREVFARVDAALGESLSTLMWEGDEETLRQTENAQPALLAVSMAAMAALGAAGADASRAAFVAGHSLGETTALCAVGVLGLEDAARLLRRRGLAMAGACPGGQGAMAALIGADDETAQKVCDAGADVGICQIANDNAPGQIVISGARAAVEKAVAAAQAMGVKRALLLPVSGPFHSDLMTPAAAQLAAALADIPFAAPARPLVCNVTARPESDPETLKRMLVEQVTARVRWRESVAWMAENGVTRLVEVGSGKVLTGLAKRIAPEVKAEAVGAPQDVEAFAASLDAAAQ